MRMDPVLEREARRLHLSTALTAHAVRSIGGRIPADAAPDDLLELARGLGNGIERVASRQHLSFEPPYPGATAGTEGVRGGLRLVLACEARGQGGEALGVVFSTLIPGRLPSVSVAPAGAPVPKGRRSVFGDGDARIPRGH
ncbi:hypothetical protein GBA65_06195 [Rubrobacter marinus]|uniref:Uncharacterized protein n=1 Tax=Rubrobacter marinus TaxID=2653852 RepID=A0A6G8PVG1_9ACTN|nr:hypothetical protein [Rubrobacter marinus]QIN78167.1 hypothetical protein GBA65_06195 [Rubrobacter marinus]